MFLHLMVRWPSADIQVKFYGDRPRGTPPSGELNTRGVAEYSDFGPIERRKRSVVEFMQESIAFLVRVQCRRKESLRSLSHLLMSILF